MALMFVFRKKKSFRIVISLSWDFKNCQKIKACVICTLLHDHLKVEFRHKGEKCPLRNTSRMQTIEFVGELQRKNNLKTANFVNFWTFFIQFRNIWTWHKKMDFIFVISRRKANWILKIYSWEFFSAFKWYVQDIPRMNVYAKSMRDKIFKFA